MNIKAFTIFSMALVPVGLAILFLPFLIKIGVEEALKRSGMGAASLERVSLIKNSLVFHDIELPQAKVAVLKINYSLGGLLRGKISGLQLEDVIFTFPFDTENNTPASIIFGSVERIDVSVIDPKAKIQELLQTPLKVEIQGLTLDHPAANARSDRIEMIIKRLDPILLENQFVQFDSVASVIDLNDAQAEFSLDDRLLDIHKAQWFAAGGKFSLSPFQTRLDENLEAKTTLSVENLDLGEVIKLVATPGLDASGRVKGTLPLRVSTKALTIDNGVLSAQSPGTLRYRPENMPAFLQQSGHQDLDALKSALTDFVYESLTLTLDGQTGKDQKVTLKASGANKDFYNAHPVRLNFSFEGALQNIFKQHLNVYNIPEAIRKQIQAYEGKNANP